MRRRTLLLAAALLVSATALAQDPDFKWDPSKKHAPAVGDKKFKEAETRQKQSVVVTSNGQVVKNATEDSTTSYRIVKECLAVKDGKVAKERVTVERWKQTRPGVEPDTSLEGVTFLIDRAGEQPKWKIEGDKKPELSAEAKKWVATELVKKKKKDEDNPLKPEAPVAANSGWKMDPAKLARMLFGEGMAIDVEKSSATGKVGDVREEKGVHFGKVTVKLVLALETLPGAPLAWTEGGVFYLDMEGDASLEEDKLDASEIEMHQTLEGKAETAAPDGSTSLIEMKIDTTMKGKDGPIEK